MISATDIYLHLDASIPIWPLLSLWQSKNNNNNAHFESYWQIWFNSKSIYLRTSDLVLQLINLRVQVLAVGFIGVRLFRIKSTNSSTTILLHPIILQCNINGKETLTLFPLSFKACSVCSAFTFSRIFLISCMTLEAYWRVFWFNSLAVPWLGST